MTSCIYIPGLARAALLASKKLENFRDPYLDGAENIRAKHRADPLADQYAVAKDFGFRPNPKALHADGYRYPVLSALVPSLACSGSSPSSSNATPIPSAVAHAT
jgi:hypothetical protein